MAKKATNPTQPEPATPTAAAKSAEKPAAKAAAKKTAKPKTSAKTAAKAEKTPAARAQVKTAPITASSSSGAKITPADIALRAYFIAEKRNELGLPGDSTSDWVEAERQLKAEAVRKPIL